MPNIGASGNGPFLLLHRHRIFNARQGVWMGWERKRGKLLDLNKLLAGEFDAFPIKAGRIDVLHQDSLCLDARLRHATPAWRSGAPGGRHCASTESGRHRSQAAHRDGGLRHSAAAYRRCRSLCRTLAAGSHLLRPKWIRHLHARHFRRLPGFVRRRHLYRQGNL